MTTSCQALARRYAQESGQPIPLSSDPTAVRSDWLLTQTWGCILPGGTFPADFHPQDPANPLNDFCHVNNNPGKSSSGQTALTRPPVYNYLKEDGFLHWVNQRGLQCVNRIVGNFYGFNSQTGSANVPSVSIAPPDSQCWGACFQVTSDSDMCFECINQTLLANPSLCPQLDPSHPDDETLIRDAVNCHECIGGQGTFIPAAPDQPLTPDETAMVNNMWRCVVGEVKPGLTTADLVVIAVVGVFVVVIAVVLGLYYGYFHPKIVKQEQQRRQLMAAGYSPDEV